jgi:hypothetical protein
MKQLKVGLKYFLFFLDFFVKKVERERERKH